jgi:hypothetical protein
MFLTTGEDLNSFQNSVLSLLIENHLALRHLVDTMIGLQNVWPTQSLVDTTFYLNNIWQTQSLVNTMLHHTFKNVNNCLNTNIYSYLETSVVKVISIFKCIFIFSKTGIIGHQ